MGNFLDEAGNPLLDEAENPLLPESGGGGGGITTASIVQQVTGTVIGSYGIGTTLISSTGGNGLVAFIGWNCVTSGSFVDVPSVCVSDSTGNLWRQIGISRAGAGVSSPTRCAVWATVNAAPVDWVSIGIAGYSSAAAWTIVEITGLAQAIDIDYSISLNASGTTPTVTGAASGADIGFALFASGSGSQSFAGPGGWGVLDARSASAGSAPAGMSIYPYWNPGVSAGSVTTAGTFGTMSSYSLVQCGLSVSSSPPAQAAPVWPVITLEAAFGTTPGDVSSSLDYTFSSEYVSWTDISDRVIGDAASGRVTATRGREYELQQEEAGNMTAYLSNYDGAFTPTNPGSPYYSNALNENMSFQTGIDGWGGVNGASLSSSTARTYATGLNAVAYRSMLITPSGVSGGPTAFTTARVPVNQNYPYSFSCWMMCPAGWSSGALMAANWYGSVGMIGSSNGTTVTLPAGAWTQIPCLNAAPPDGSEQVIFGPVIMGNPSNSTLFYVAEAAVAEGSSAVSTGLVALQTPVRLSCWWEGRQYPLWTGYVERWPQGWPDMPQWGFSQITATDALAVAAANSMQSALVGEVLIDNPYAYLPCNEQYTTQVVGATPTNLFFYSGSPQLVPVDANGQTALNRANGNQTSGVYFDGINQQVSTGLSVNFLGDDGTGMGAAGYSANAVAAGPSMQYSDPGLPSVLNSSAAAGFTIEFWFVFDNDNVTTVEMLTGFGPPSSFPVNGANVPNGANLIVTIGPTSGLELSVTVGGVDVLTPLTSSASPQHCVIVVGNGSTPTVTVYLNGSETGTLTAPFSVQIYALVLGPGRYVYDCQLNEFTPFYFSDNYVAGHLAMYDYQLPAGRVNAHYQAGAGGWAGVSAAQRFAQILDWAQLGLRRGGYLKSSATGVAELTAIGPAYQLNGSTASDAVNAVAQSEGGQYYVKADGTVTYLERMESYNLTAQATLGDNATSATSFLNRNYGFTQGTSGWSGDNCTIAYASSPTYAGYGSLLVTPGGSSSSVSASASSVPVTGGSSYTAGAWVQSITGWTDVLIGFDLYLGGSFVSASTVTYAAPIGSWFYVTTTVECPVGTVNRFALRVGESGTPAAGNTLYVAFAAMWEASPEVPYEKETEFDYDNSYLYNEVTATLQSGPNDLTVYDDRNLPSEQAYFRRSALSITSNVVSPYDVSDVTTWSIAEFSQPSIHVASVKVDVAANPLVAFPVALNVDIGDIVQVNRRPVGGAVISELGIVEKVSVEIGARYFYVTYQLSPYAPSNQVLCADTAGYDDPGSNNALILGW